MNNDDKYEIQEYLKQRLEVIANGSYPGEEKILTKLLAMVSR